MVHKQKTDPDTYEYEGKNKKKQMFRLNQYEIFCELCWHIIHRDIEYRQLQNQNHQLMTINRSHSVGAKDHEAFHSSDKHHLGQLVQDQFRPKKENLRDPLIKQKLIGAKLVKWRLFVYVEKFIQFDEDIIHEIVKKVDAQRAQQGRDEMNK